MNPQPYDMTNPDDVKRWFREMENYLKTSDFLHLGTDFEGRKYALEGFRDLRKIENKSSNKDDLYLLKKALTRFRNLADSLDCECDSYNGYECPIHEDRRLARTALEILEAEE